MAVHRVRIAKDKAELVQALVDFKGTSGPFLTYADVMVFAAALGAKANRRVPLGVVAKEPAPISLEIFISRGYDTMIKLLGVVETRDTKILSAHSAEAENQRVEIFEEYANGGLQSLKDELRGAVDYSERLLLILNRQRFKEDLPEQEFDLSRFL